MLCLAELRPLRPARSAVINCLFYKAFREGAKRMQASLPYQSTAATEPWNPIFALVAPAPGRRFRRGAHENEDQGRVPVPITISRGMFISLPFQSFFSSARISPAATAFLSGVSCSSSARNGAAMEHASALPEFHDCGIVEVFPGGAFDVAIRFAGSGGGRQRDAELIRKVEREAEILVHKPKRKTRNVLAFEKIRRLHVQDAGPRHAGLQYLDELFARKARAGNKGQSFRERVHLQR